MAAVEAGFVAPRKCSGNNCTEDRAARKSPSERPHSTSRRIRSAGEKEARALEGSGGSALAESAVPMVPSNCIIGFFAETNMAARAAVDDGLLALPCFVIPSSRTVTSL